MSDPVFLTIEQVKAFHRMALDRHGGQDSIRDEGRRRDLPCETHDWSGGNEV